MADAASMRRADLIVHPVRLRILMTLSGRKLTTRQLGKLLPDIPQASLYRYLTQLCAADVVTVVSETAVRGAIEKVYTVNPQAGLLRQEETEAMEASDYERYFTTFVALLLEQMQAFVRRAPSAEELKRINFFTMPVRLNDEEHKKLVHDLFDLHEQPKEHEQDKEKDVEDAPDPGRTRRMLSFIMIPDPPE